MLWDDGARGGNRGWRGTEGKLFEEGFPGVMGWKPWHGLGEQEPGSKEQEKPGRGKVPAMLGSSEQRGKGG